MNLKKIVLMGMLTLGYSQTKPIEFPQIHNYAYGVMDVDGDKVSTKNDYFFICLDINKNGRTDIAYFHEFTYYKPFKQNGIDVVDFDVNANSSMVLYDFDEDGKWDFKTNEQINNKKRLLEIFKGHEVDPIKIEYIE